MIECKKTGKICALLIVKVNADYIRNKSYNNNFAYIYITELNNSIL